MATEPQSPREAAEAAAAAWIARRDTPEWDAAAFEAWLGESVSHRVAYYRLNAVWHETGRLRVLRGPAEETNRVMADELPQDSDRLHTQPAGTRRVRHFRVWAVAASVVIAVIALAGVLKLRTAVPGQFETRVGGLAVVPLADGSRVTLNTDSELQVSLKARERAVSLDRGEAYFEVAKDPSRPFIVNVGTKRVIAVGTQFSVRRDRDEVSVVVREGTVRMEDRRARSPSAPASGEALSSSAPGTEPASAGSADVVLLPAGSVARAQADAVLVEKEPAAEIEQHLSWRSGQLVFRDTPLSDAVAEFNRYNERKIVIEDPSIARLQLGGVFRSTNIDPFIELLEQGFPVRATPEGDRILLTHN